jgi:hypothetical protein
LAVPLIRIAPVACAATPPSMDGQLPCTNCRRGWTDESDPVGTAERTTDARPSPLKPYQAGYQNPAWYGFRGKDQQPLGAFPGSLSRSPRSRCGSAWLANQDPVDSPRGVQSVICAVRGKLPPTPARCRRFLQIQGPILHIWP